MPFDPAQEVSREAAVIESLISVQGRDPCVPTHDLLKAFLKQRIVEELAA